MRIKVYKMLSSFIKKLWSLRNAQYIVPLALLVLILAGRHTFPYFVEGIKHRSFDYFQKIRPREYVPTVPVHVIDIDDASLEKYGQWPWPRSFIAQLVYALRDYGVSVIAFDSVFPEKDRTSPKEAVKSWPDSPYTSQATEIAGKLPDNDEIFAKAISEGGVVLGFPLSKEPADDTIIGYSMNPGQESVDVKYSYAQSGQVQTEYLLEYDGTTVNIPVLEKAAAGVGSFTFDPEEDGMLRKVPMVYNKCSSKRKIINSKDNKWLRSLIRSLKGSRNGSSKDSSCPLKDSRFVPSLSAEALRVYQGAKMYAIKYSNGSGSEFSMLQDRHLGVDSIKIGKFTMDTDERGRVWVYFTKDSPGRMISVKDVMEKKVPEDVLKGAITLIGTSAAGLMDLRNTPLNSALPGVEVHANILEQTITGEHLLQPYWSDILEFWYTLLASSLVIFLLPRRGALGRTFVSLFFVGLFACISWFAFVYKGFLIDPVCPIVAVILVAISSLVTGYKMTENEKEHVRTAFGRYISKDMVEQLAEHPEKLKLGGEMRNMTILFCDIRGFTTISEQYDSIGLTKVINRFLTPMTEIIMKRKGCIDKYIGDCIMAFWNAPIDDKDHIKNACESALVMQERLAELNKKWEEASKTDGTKYLPINIGVGLNTDECCVGNLGSDQRFNYSVLGDGVNLASRLEGQSKAYGVKIVIGPKTNDGADGFATLELDLIKVKGKTRPVNIYTLLGRKEMLESQEFKSQKEAHDSMIAAYRSADFSRAEELLALCRTSFAESHGLGKLYDLYAGRIEAFKANPPDSDWDGTYTATSK